jgi:restriction endonuclease S subunit
MAIAENIGYDATGRPAKDEFPDILTAWQKFKKDNRIGFFVKTPLCFTVGRGEMEGRADPFYHKPEFRMGKLSNKYKIGELGDFLEEIRYGASLKNIYALNGIPLLRITNLKPCEINLQEVVKLPFGCEKSIGKCIVKEDDFLISRSGTIGIVAIVPKEANNFAFGSFMIKFSLDNRINHKYVQYLLNLDTSQKIFQRNKIGAIQGNITIPVIKSFPIPVPPHQIQDKIANIMDEAYRLKKEKETKSNRLLDSLNDYVLSELGIKLPQSKDEKKFTLTFDKIKGKRFDPYSHQPKFQKANNALMRGKYQLRNIGELIADISGGATPKAKGDSYTGPEGIPFLRIQNVTPDGISLEGMNYINEQTHEGLLKRSQLKGSDVVFTITGRIGTVAVIPMDWEKGNINQHMVRLRFKEEILPDYFAAYFNTSFGNQQALCLTSGGSRIALDYKAIRSLRIPLPPFQIQQQIVEEVNARREKAKKLKAEAQQILNQAKAEVEKFILGGNYI